MRNICEIDNYLRDLGKKGKVDLRNTGCVLSINCYSPVQEASYLKKTLKVISGFFKSYTIWIDDFLHRNTLQISQLEDKKDLSIRKSVEMGDIWLERNRDVYNSENAPSSIMRYSSCVESNNFLDSLEKVVNLYKENSDYHDLILEDMERWFEWYELHFGYFNRKKAFPYCLHFVIERCAIQIFLAAKGYGFIGMLNETNVESVKTTYAKLIKPFYINAGRPLWL